MLFGPGLESRRVADLRFVRESGFHCNPASGGNEVFPHLGAIGGVGVYVCLGAEIPSLHFTLT
jgi:hypothetical protein